MGLRRNLQIVFSETTGTVCPNSGERIPSERRYVARAFSASGPGWGVFDRKADRFLKDREVSRLTVEAIRQPVALN